MQQWRDVKARHPDTLVFFRVGDFYELFHGDAERGAKLLGLTLTARNNGAANRVPLAGIPVKALQDYLGRLVRLGERVAICEQVEDPAQAKGIVRREVTETITPGTILDDQLLEGRRNNLLLALAPSEDGIGIAAMDLSTGEFELQCLPEAEVASELGRLEPAELLLPRKMEGSAFGFDRAITLRDDWSFDAQPAEEELRRVFRVHGLDGFGLRAEDHGMIGAAGALLAYVREIRPSGTGHLQAPRIRHSGDAMVLDEMTRRNLELVEALRGGESSGTLLSVIDRTETAMGARLLRRWVMRPLLRPEAIWERQEAVSELVETPRLRRALRDQLGDVTDLERLAGKLGTGRGSPRDLLGLLRSLGALPPLLETLSAAGCEGLQRAAGAVDPLLDLHSVLARAIASEAPVSVQDGGVIRAGYDDTLDEVRGTLAGARDFILSLQAREREQTGIGSLKVGFNKVFGYYLEVTKANLGRVPDSYVRKQTLTNGERYFTPELKEWEEKVFGAEDQILKLESELFGEVRSAVAAEVARLQGTAAALAEIDALSSLAEVAESGGWVRPEVHTGYELSIEGGRHPVVETTLPKEDFVPNDIALDEDARIVILTGPNMSGKSTLLRQVGLIQLLAQMGGFVPARSARVPVADRIFTRVGASDDLARGHSTFMVEMHETAAITHGATASSLILLDEIGRGTATYDGVSIAWAVTEHLHETVGAKAIFATHYHELTQLSDLLPAVENRHVAVREVGDEIVFLRRLEPGGADRSYGIEVARLAGLPPPVVARARELLEELEMRHGGRGDGLGRSGQNRPAGARDEGQFTLFAPQEHGVVRFLRDLDPESVTPIEALNILAKLVREAGGKE